jgi:hypothetical protein
MTPKRAASGIDHQSPLGGRARILAGGIEMILN